jgi:hypothetical protein
MRAAHDPSSSHVPRGLWGHFLKHIREDWPAIVFIPALISVLHHFNFLYGIDAYAFLTISNLTAAFDRGKPPSDPHAVVVLIDDQTFERRYLERSPLNRCRLLEDLTAIYAAEPRLVAIDLDISPAALIAAARNNKSENSDARAAAKLPSEDEVACEEGVHRLIREKSSEKTKIGTVMMTPFPAVTTDLDEAQKTWVAEMKKAPYVRFGNADLPVEYGVVVNQFARGDSFAGAAHDLYDQLNPNRHTAAKQSALPVSAAHANATPATADMPKERESELERINPRLYVSGILPVSYTEESKEEDATRSRIQPQPSTKEQVRRFQQRLTEALKQVPDRVVFYGGAYGMDDVFVTPLGQLYGVEVQAAAYLSRIFKIGAKEGLALLGDIVFALLFSLLIAFCWKRYFTKRMSTHPRDRQLAVINLLWLAGGVIAAALFLSGVSLLILRWSGIWLSPVPIAIGMLLDAFVLGSISHALEVATEQKLKTVHRLQRANTSGIFEEVAADELTQRRPHAHTFAESIRRFFFRDWEALYSKGENAAARALMLKRAVWLVIVGLASLFAVLH